MARKQTTTATGEVAVKITAPRIREAVFQIVGTAPYVQNAFSQKAREQMKATQMAGSQARGKKKREPKDFKAGFEQAQHRSEDGWNGIPASAFRNAMIRACSLVGFKMTLAKLSVFVASDGLDAIDSTPLVKITGKPRHVEHYVRNETGVVDIRPRAMWDPGWTATVRVQFDEDQFSLTDVSNLLHRVGAQVGIGEGRPGSPNSAGMGWGLFELRATREKAA
jgi:hypothetical protein